MSAQFLVEVPAGLGPGHPLQAVSPDGQQIQFTVPAGYGPGMSVPVAYTPMAHNASAPLVAAPMAVPMMAANPGQQLVYCGATDPWTLLSGLQSVKITQQVQMAEVLVGFEMPNKYVCSDPLTNMDLFVAAERSAGIGGMIGRQLFEGGQRPFEMDVALLTGPAQPPLNFIHLERPFKCTCCCFERPEVYISNSMTGQLLGSVVDPFACCMMTFDIKDIADNPVLEISHNPCDLSLVCWGCCCGCQEVDFEIRDKATGSTVGHIRKQFTSGEAIGMFTGLGFDAQQYEVDFGGVSSPDWKAMVLGTALFLDYRFFTSGGQTGRDNSLLGAILDN